MSQLEDTYNPQEIEKAVQESWEKQQAYKVTEDAGREKFYCLCMFPYPSGKLHMGHVRNYTIGDVISRYQRMLGKNVLQPMGWDAFGLPAENAAMANHLAPAEWTYSNIDYMKVQLQRLGFAYDWSREFATCRPEYYRWEQWLFTQLMGKGLVYRKNSIVNWDPVDKTVLANEQVIEGRGWRSGALVERREIPQWSMKITDYADELLDELDGLDEWPESVKTMQRNWIGRSKGLELEFAIDGHPAVKVFTTRPDTLMGVSYLAVAPEHSLAEAAARSNSELGVFLDSCKRSSVAEADIATAEKLGMALGIIARHPITGDEIPVWVANFVLMAYGTGAVMAVPGHDQRDWEFAHKYQLPIIQVIQASDGDAVDVTQSAYLDHGQLINSGDDYNGLNFEDAFHKIEAYCLAHQCGERQINYRLRDWGISRQRFWGCPIPVIHCVDCGAVPVSEKDLPVVLPESMSFDADSGSPIVNDKSFYQCACPVCGKEAKRDTDTFDTFMESSWYFARFACPDADAMLDERADYWLPVDQYIGGIEHAILHLLYARFFQKLMRDIGLTSVGEPFKRLLTQGMVVAETFTSTESNGSVNYFSLAEVEVSKDSKGKIVDAVNRQTGVPLKVGNIEKMSKSRNNGVDPQSMIQRYGADTVRLFSMFAAPPEQSLEWLETGVEGSLRFLNKLWRAIFEHLSAGSTEPLLVDSLTAEQRKLRSAIHQTIHSVNDDIGRRHTFNTAIAKIMSLINSLAKFDDASPQTRALKHDAWQSIVLMLAPIVPHICDRLWRALGSDESILDQHFPVADPAALINDEDRIIVQVNGKKRSQLNVDASMSRDALSDLALDDDKVQGFIDGKTVKKIIVVPHRLVNIVV